MAPPVGTNAGHMVHSTSGLSGRVSFMGKCAELFRYKSEESAPLNLIELTNAFQK